MLIAHYPRSVQHSRLLFVVALAVVLAGCAGLADRETRETERLTPVPVGDGATAGTAVPEPVPEELLPPGVAATGDVDTARLARAHGRALDNRTYTLRYRRTERSPTGVSENITRVVYHGSDRTLVRNYASRTGLNRSWFLTERDGYRRTASADGTTVAEVALRRGDGRFVQPGSLLTQALSGRNASVSTVRDGGRRFVRLYVPPGPRPPPTRLFRVRQFTATAYVAPDGYVRSLDVAFTTRRNDVTFRFEYVDVGSTRVTVPEWVRERRSEPDASP